MKRNEMQQIQTDILLDHVHIGLFRLFHGLC